MAFDLLRSMSGHALADLFPPYIGRLHIHAPVPVRIPRQRLPRMPRNGWPDIALVTPAFRHGEFIERTIRSVLMQDYPLLRYAVMDGGSNDQTQDILRHYAPRLGVCYSGPDGGQTAAINAGFRQLPQTEIMGWLNSDDLHLPSTLHRVAAFFANNPDADVVYGHRILIDGDDREIGRWVLPPHDEAVLAWADFIPQETLFWRRRIWDRIGGSLDETFRFAMDWDLILRFVKAGARFVRLPHFLGCFRVHSEQKTQSQLELSDIEMTRLRERCNPGRVSPEAIREGIRAYTVRHAAWQRARWVGDRLRRHEAYDPSAAHTRLGPALRPAAKPAHVHRQPLLRHLAYRARRQLRVAASVRWQAGATPRPNDITPIDGSIRLTGESWSLPTEDTSGIGRNLVGRGTFTVAPQPAASFRLRIDASITSDVHPEADMLAVLDARGRRLGDMALDGRSATTIELPMTVGQGMSGVLQLMLRGQPSTATCRVHGLTGAGDIVKPGGGIRLGGDWHAFEFFEGEWFRWSMKQSTLRLTPPARQFRLDLVVEPGPGAPGHPFRIGLTDEGGRTVASSIIRRRSRIGFELHSPDGQDMLLRLTGHRDVGRTFEDPRRLCFRVLRMRIV